MFCRSRLSALLNKFGLPVGLELKAQRAKSFREDQHREKAFETRDRGVHEIALEHIVGSVGRYHDFDQQFRIGSHLPAERLEKIKNALRRGNSLPPVKLYQIKNQYYVLDGNHRVAAAKQLGHNEIKAHIFEFIPSKKSIENLLYREKLAFEDHTLLTCSIELTEFGQYSHLTKQISKHRDFLAGETRDPVSIQTAALDWYQTIYRPLVAVIDKGDLLAHFPHRTLADLYAYVSYHQWENTGEQLKLGIGFSKLVPDDMEEFRKKMATVKETEYPEMLRLITAFVLMSVSAKKEIRIVDKLFALPEVKEIHSVHGSIDVIAKIVLKRNLLSSDAETIGDFVHNQIRQIPGILSTQTLIPGYSKEKKNG
jgi:uncharacterized ParB-like nuclease family protein